MAKNYHVVVTLVLSVLVWHVSPASAQDPHYVQPGFQHNHDYFSQLPFESIDLGTGSVVLTFTDLTIPGNAGRQWRFQRTYNNKDRKWTYGLGGMVMSVQDTWPPPAVLPGEMRIRPALYGADGARHETNILVSNPSCPTLSDCQWVVTDQFWWYDRDARKLYLPDGLINSYDTQGRLIDSTDAFGNSVGISWSASSGGTATVTVHLGNSQDQVVTLALRTNSQVGYNASSYEPESMTFRGREWVYTNPVALSAVRMPLVQSPDVYARGWAYTYVETILSQSVLHEIKVTTPQGGQVRYISELKSYPPVVPGGPNTETNNLVQRVLSGPSVPANSTWTFQYDTYRAAWGTNSGARRIDSPSGIQYWYQYGFGLEAGYTRREVEFNSAVPESELRTFVKRATVGYSTLAVAAERSVLTRSDVTRDGRTYRTDYVYDSGFYSNYHRPSQIVEKGNLQPDGSGETNRTTTLGYDYNFNLTPNTNSQRYFNGKVGGETVTLQGETLTRAWGYDHTTGCLGEVIEYDIHTGFECDALGNVSKIKPGQIVSKQTTFTYDWGVLKNTVTPQFTISRSINTDGTVASVTQGGRTTAFTYDNAFRVTQVQPPGGTNPTTTTYNNVDGSTVITQRGSSSVTTTLDGLGRTISTLDSASVRTRTAYDTDERVSYHSYPYTSTDVGTTITYDALGRVKRRTNPDATYIEYTYGAGTTATRAANARTTTDTWQAFGNPNERRIVTVTDPANQQWQYLYNAHGDLTKVIAPDSTERAWTYNSNQRLTSETHPESGTVTYSAFDSAGVPSRKTDARGTVFDAVYDNNYRVTQLSAGARVTTTTFEADTDNRASVGVGNVATSFTYDSAGRLATRTDAISGRSYQRSFGYDANDRLTTLTYPSGRQITYQYDTVNRITKVTDATASRDIATTFSYHPSGAPTAFTSGNGSSTVWATIPAAIGHGR